MENQKIIFFMRLLHLLFAHKFKVEYSNNMSERALREYKNRKKVVGRFRTSKGREIEALNKSKRYYTSTLELLKSYAEMVPLVDEQK